MYTLKLWEHGKHNDKNNTDKHNNNTDQIKLLIYNYVHINLPKAGPMACPNKLGGMSRGWGIIAAPPNYFPIIIVQKGGNTVDHHGGGGGLLRPLWIRPTGKALKPTDKTKHNYETTVSSFFVKIS